MPWFLPIGRLNTMRLLGISGGARQRDLAEPDCFGRDQDALGIHAVQDVFEAASLFTKAILQRNFEILEEQFVGIDRLAAHLLDLVHRDALRSKSV